MVILIDDDKLVYLGWRLKASKIGLNIIHYYSVTDFLLGSEALDQNSTIYIDADLGNKVRGEIEAKKIFEAGFQKIYLVTGYDKSEFDLEKLVWIKDVLTKDSPF